MALEPQQKPQTDPWAGFDTGVKTAPPQADPWAGFDTGVKTEPAQAPERTWVDTAVDVGKGIGKGLASTAVGLGKVAYWTIPPVHAVADLVASAGSPGGIKMNAAAGSYEAARSEVQPTNTAQRVGQTIEQVGEFFALPTGKGSLIRQGVTRAAGAAGLSSVQGASPAGAGVAGAIDFVSPAAGKAVSAVAKPLRAGAEKAVTQALGASKERFKAMAGKVAPGVLDRKVTGWTGTSREKLLETAKAKAREAGEAIDQELTKQAGTVVDPKPVIAALEKAKQTFIDAREVTAQELLGMGKSVQAKATQLPNGNFSVPVVLDQRPVRQLAQLQGVIDQLGPNPTIEQIIHVRRVWDTIVDQAGGYAQRSSGGIGVPLKEQSEAWTKREATKAIRAKLADDFPDLKAVNADYHFYRQLEDVLTQTQQRTQPQSTGLYRAISTVTGTGVGYSQGTGIEDRLEKALLGGAVGHMMVKAFTSPRYRFVTAKLKNELAEAISSGSIDRTLKAFSRVTAAMASQTVAPTR